MWITLPRLLCLAVFLYFPCFTSHGGDAVASDVGQQSAVAQLPVGDNSADSRGALSAPVPREPMPDVSVPPSVNAAKQEEPGSTKQRIEEQLRAVQNAQQVDETTKAGLLKRYTAALDWLTASEEARNKTSQYKAEIAGATELLAKVKTQLAAPVSDSPMTFSAEATLQDMEQSLTQTEGQLKEADTELSRREEELKRRGERKAELAKLIDDTRQRLDEARKQLSSPPSSGESTELASARRVECEAHLAALESQVQRYRVEVQRYDALVELLPLQRDMICRERNLREKQVAALRNAVAAKRKAESERHAREAQQEAANSHPALRELAERNATLAEHQKILAESITKTTDKVTATEKTLAGLEEEFQNTRERVRYAGNSSSIGLVLRKERRELPDTGKCEQHIRSVARVMPEANLGRMELQEERTSLGDIDTAARDAVANLDPRFAASRDYLKKTVRELLEKKRDLLDELINGYDQYLTKLSELEIGSHKLVAKTEEFAGYIDERVLWVRSADALGPGCVTDAAGGLLGLAQPGPWIELSRQCGLDVIRQPGVIVLLVVALGILIAVQTRLRNRMRSLCVVSSGGVNLNLWPTLEGLLLAAVTTAPLPLSLAIAGLWMARADGISDLGQALGFGLQYSALLLWVARFTRRLCMPGLLAESHFGWSAYSLAIARRHLRWLTYCGFPVVFVVIFAHHYHDGAWNSSIGRIAFIGAMLLLAVFMRAIFFAKNNVLRDILDRKPDLWLTRFWFVFYLLVIGLPTSLALLAGAGYYYSAQQLALRLEATLALVLGLVLLHAVVSRWFLVKRRNLAIAQMKERHSRESEGVHNTAADIPVANMKQDLSVVHKELRYLLTNAVAVCLLVGSWMIWVDVFPALKVLDKQELWRSTVEVVEVHEDASGNAVHQKVPTEVPTTARHALIAGLLLIATVVICRRLPAILEITLLGRMRFDRGGRHAISVLLRYLVALIGVLLACRTLSITWVSVQWLAAGITLGLGFGLQEIFANFVSGIILLFERPIRVGDVVTLGDTTGTVTDIRIRATTVTNWDRKELIVPNKELITGRLLNWTLTDPVNRIVITVGVAYKSDTRKARELIMEIASEHPNVLDDPASRVTFESFGDSALNFVLRCYIASMDIRLDTIHELHEAIHDRFNEEGVEIAFPQMDLHVRTAGQMVSLLASSKQAREDAA